MPEDEDIEELERVLTVVEEKVPKLLREIVDAVSSPERARKMGEAIAEFYKKLKESGMSDEMAEKLTFEFLRANNIMNLLDKLVGDERRGEGFAEKLESISKLLGGERGHKGDSETPKTNP
ncbi:MAG: hypothetical protein J7J79_04260 [Thermoplasmata archaeon]|nr:hypothetical protein [Thermoplasmata archaeon]